MLTPKFQLTNGRYIIAKSPQSLLDYGVRLAYWMQSGDTLKVGTDPTWETSSGLTAQAPFVINDPTYGLTAGVWLSGGVIDAEEWARVTWQTTNGRIEVQTLWFIILPR